MGYLRNEALREEVHRFVEIAFTSILPAVLGASPQLSYALDADLIYKAADFLASCTQAFKGGHEPRVSHSRWRQISLRR